MYVEHKTSVANIVSQSPGANIPNRGIPTIVRSQASSDLFKMNNGRPQLTYIAIMIWTRRQKDFIRTDSTNLFPEHTKKRFGVAKTGDSLQIDCIASTDSAVFCRAGDLLGYGPTISIFCFLPDPKKSWTLVDTSHLVSIIFAATFPFAK